MCFILQLLSAFATTLQQFWLLSNLSYLSERKADVSTSWA